MLATMTHDELASSLAAHLRSGRCGHRVTWENLEFSDWTDQQNGFRCRPDVFSIFPTLDVAKCRPWSHEVKISRADFQSDMRSGKWRSYARFSCRVFFAAPKGLISELELPPEAGLWEFDHAKNERSRWLMVKPAKFCKGWFLPPRHLMKLILGRWGTFAGHLPHSDTHNTGNTDGAPDTYRT